MSRASVKQKKVSRPCKCLVGLDISVMSAGYCSARTATRRKDTSSFSNMSHFSPLQPKKREKTWLLPENPQTHKSQEQKSDAQAIKPEEKSSVLIMHTARVDKRGGCPLASFYFPPSLRTKVAIREKGGKLVENDFAGKKEACVCVCV